MPGPTISAIEITHVSLHGVWVLLDDEELLMPFEQFPWFRQATIGQLHDVERPTPDHLYWPQLDVDLAVESLRNPAAFPRVATSESRNSPPPQHWNDGPHDPGTVRHTHG